MSGGPDYDRTPPQDVAAEQSVLGRHAAEQGRDRRRRRGAARPDFYRPAHELVYDAILDLYGRGEPA
jgi:replicative DNA helicase